ncbi:MAG: heparinase [Xanthomonadales bacterium]|nr:heparinase [Xanthomonadales bacterium]
MRSLFMLFLAGLLCSGPPSAQGSDVPPEWVTTDRLLSDTELVAMLDPQSFPEAAAIQALYDEDPDAALQHLAARLRDAFAERYYFDWRRVEGRFDDYRKRFPSREAQHRSLAKIHAGLYPAAARWKLPYRNLKGNEVTAYELRHLARQHKMLDMAFVHLYDKRDPVHVDYFTGQMRSLNRAFMAGEFEDDEGGNGVYESFRAGYRVLNWLQVHAFFLGSDAYRWQDQVELVRTLLHTGAILHQKNQKFRYGNHQTRGAVALALIAILFRDFAGTEAWYENAMAILDEHLEREVNADGFQFERSVHYHTGDVLNYFRVMQLARINGFDVPTQWERRLKKMFEAAVVLARPDRRLPVLQDDTDQPWAEFNEVDAFMMLGAVLFDDPQINYFAARSVASDIYWLLRGEQFGRLEDLQRRRPQLASSALPQTGYYVMREGWSDGDHHLVISAGLSERKPDHQHGDMLGLVAHANGQEILPNYQVRYSLDDYIDFKNSRVKNVTLVDGLLHGRDWRGNKGGSGFGKWGFLPNPTVIAWRPGPDWDFFAGSHDGYEALGVTTFRSVLFLKGLGWIVRDRLESSTGPHEYQQVWQGHYSQEQGNVHHRATFADGSGLEIVQLGATPDSWARELRRGKGNLVYTQSREHGDFLTLLYPYAGFSGRLPYPMFVNGVLESGRWTIRIREGEALQSAEFRSDASVAIESGEGVFLMGATWFEKGDARFSLDDRSDLFLAKASAGGKVTWLGYRVSKVTVEGPTREADRLELRPGEASQLPR